MKYQGITVFKSKNCNTWYARYRDGGVQKFISARTQIECYEKLKKAVKTRTLKERGEVVSAETFLSWYEKWLKTYKTGKVKDSTLKDYKESLKYLKNIFDVKLTALTNLKITEQLNQISFSRRKQKVYELLNAVLNKAVKNNLLKNNPITDEKPKHKRVNGISLSIEDQQKFSSICRGKYEMFLICLYQGLRRGEMLALTKQDFDFKNKTLTVNKSLNLFNELDDTKNEYSSRVIPLFDVTIELIQDKLISLEESDRVFNYSNQWCEKLFKKLKDENGLNEKYTIHSLRHTFITSCQEKNIPLHIVQRWVGHRLGSKVTNEVYTHARTEIESQFLDIMNE